MKAGAPVIVTVGGVIDANAHGGGAYAELNFEAGTANYIEPLLLSVLQVRAFQLCAGRFTGHRR